MCSAPRTGLPKGLPRASWLLCLDGQKSGHNRNAPLGTLKPNATWHCPAWRFSGGLRPGCFARHAKAGLGEAVHAEGQRQPESLCFLLAVSLRSSENRGGG